MTPQIIKNSREHKALLNWADKMFDKKVKTNTSKGQKLKEVLLMIKEYEDRHYPVPKQVTFHK